MTTTQRDVSAAARLVAAVSADDTAGWAAVLNEARAGGWLTELCMAVAAQCVSIAGEYYQWRGAGVAGEVVGGGESSDVANVAEQLCCQD